MGDQTIDIRKSTPHIGAEIFGVNLSHPLGNQQFQEVHDALMDRLVIFFRDQTISVEQQKDFARRFGRLHTHPASPNVVPGHPEVMVIAADESSKYIAGEDWHSDVSCDPEPPMGTMLYLTEVPPDGGGDTMFANMYLAYETLSEPIRKLVDGLSAVHDGEPFYRGRYDVDDSGKKYPRAEHPVVRMHPITGRRCLFVNRFFTTRLTQPIASLTVQVFTYAIAPYEDWHQKAWAAAFTLVVIILILNVSVRYLTRSKHG